MSCPECAKLEKKLRVMQADFQFEIRKLSEDNSTQKALFQISVQKDIRKWQEKYTKERIDHEQNSKKWLQKIDSVTFDCQKRVKQMQLKWQKAMAALTEKSQKELQEFKQTAESRLNAASKKLIQKHQQESTYKENYYQQLIESLKHTHALQIETLRKLSHERQEKTKNQYESCILGLKSEKNADQRNNIKLQEQFRIQKTKLISQMYEFKYKISTCEEKIKELKNIVKDKEDFITRKEKEIIQLTTSFETMINQLKSKHERSILDQEMRMEEKTKEFYENQLKITEKYELSIAKIQQHRLFEMQIYRTNMNEIKNCVENRASRLEDIEQILLLKEKLSKKQKEFEILERELKDYQLQLENKEDTYNKIFIPTINSTHLPGENVIKRKQLKMKRPAARNVTTVREILNSVNINTNNLPLLNNLDKKVLLPPKSTKIL